MKFALNGAPTFGTLDGANVEIREEVGAENFFLFGKRVEENQAIRAEGSYNPWQYYYDELPTKRVLDFINSDFLNLEQPDLYRPLWDSLLEHGDHYFHLADFKSYIEAQEQVDEAYRDPAKWARMCILNIAQSGKFTSDRTIGQYAEEIWGIEPCPIDDPEGRH